MPNANGASDAQSGAATTRDAPFASRPQHPDVRTAKATPSDVLVLAFGSHAFRYGSASDSTPVKLPSLVAFPRKSSEAAPAIRPVWATATPSHDVAEFDAQVENLVSALDMRSRRIGGGKPIPWDVEVEVVARASQDATAQLIQHIVERNAPVVGREADVLLRDEAAAARFDIVAPLWDGKLVFGATSASDTLVRAALDELLSHVALQLDRKHANGHPPNGAAANGKKTNAFAFRHVAIVVPDTSDRRDVAEIVDAIFRVDQLRAAAVFVHQSSVSCALGAGLGTCAVVDIGHAATTVACVEEGTICADSRVHLTYGAHQMLQIFHRLLRNSPHFVEQIADVLGSERDNDARYKYDFAKVAARTCEQICSFRTEENDRLLLAETKTPAGHTLRVKVGLALRTLPAHGLVKPAMLLAASDKVITRKRTAHERNCDDDNYLEQLYSEIRRNATATAALPIGRFANQPDAPVDYQLIPTDASIVDAVIWAVGRAVKASTLVVQQPNRAPELHRRFLKSIVLSGGGASLEGIALALERHIKDALQQKGLVVSEVTVIDGGKGKGDEELAAANAILRDEKGAPAVLGDDTDTASLPWKGCAVMVEADAVKDYWLYKDDWLERNVRVLRERVPFYW